MLRVVFDTVVFVRALLNPKSRCGRLLFKHFEQYQVIVSQATARELLEVVQRPEITIKYPAVSMLEKQRIITPEPIAVIAVVGDPGRFAGELARCWNEQ